jgi:hypothetical protein
MGRLTPYLISATIGAISLSASSLIGLPKLSPEASILLNVFGVAQVAVGNFDEAQRSGKPVSGDVAAASFDLFPGPSLRREDQMGYPPT